MSKHTCGGPSFGRLAPAGQCTRCDELRQGAQPRTWGGRTYTAKKMSFAEEYRLHKQACKICRGIEGGICTFGES